MTIKMDSDEEPLDKFDDERILQGLVTPEEINELERTLIRMFLEKAQREGKLVVVLKDLDKYKKLMEDKTIFKGDKFYLFIDPETEKLGDMCSVVYHLIDTDAGLFYAKLMPL